jgi:hypothetical protein
MTYYILCTPLSNSFLYDVLDSEGFITTTSTRSLSQAITNYKSSYLNRSLADTVGVYIKNKGDSVRCSYNNDFKVDIPILAELSSLDNLTTTHPELFM